MTYHRQIDVEGNDSLAKLARWVRPGWTVLELGPATGYFTRHLVSLGSVVDVVEVDREAALEAGRHARHTIVADLERSEWIEQLGGRRYDAIVCADVLEHLRDGQALLRRLRPLLSEGGELLLSVPNVAHSALIARLIEEEFEYGPEGLLDSTHVRLYTWRSLARTLHGAGYSVVGWDATTLPAFATEFRVNLEALPPPIHEALIRRPHALVYQWLARAVPGDARVPLVPGPFDGIDSVPLRFLQAESAAALTLDRADTVAIPIGGSAIAQDWSLQAGTRAIRLLLSDRPGVIDIQRLALCAGARPLWSFDGDPSRVRCSTFAAPLDAGRIALAEGGAWIEPSVPEEVIASADRLHCTAAWPASVLMNGEHAAFDAVASEWRRSDDAAHARGKELVALVEERDARLAALRDELARHLEVAHAERERLERALAAQERIIAYRQSLRWWLALPLVRARSLLRRVTGA